MRIEEAFRVALIPNMREALLVEITRKWDHGREVVRKILAPLSLGSRLEFGQDQDQNGRGWFVVKVHLSGQQCLFDELDALDIPGCSPEAAAARALLKAYVADLKSLVRKLRVSGAQLEDFVERMPDLSKLQATFGIATGDQKSISIHCGGDTVEDFVLAAQPPQHILPQVHPIGFCFKKIGTTEADIIIPKAFRRVLGIKSRKCTLRWDSSTVDAATWEHFVCCLKQGAFVRAAVKVVRKATGSFAEFLLESFVRSEPEAVGE